MPPSSARARSDDAFVGSPLEEYRENFGLIHREVRRILAPRGLLVSEAGALKLAAGSPVRPSEVAERLGVTASAATQLVDRLERRGLLRRTRDPEDRRAVVLVLTPSGRRLFRATAREVRAMLDGVAEEMSPDGRRALVRGAAELHRALDRWHAGVQA